MKIMTAEKSKTETARRSDEVSLRRMLPREWLARAVITSSGLVADYGTNKQLSLERLVAESGEKAALLGSGTVSPHAHLRPPARPCNALLSPPFSLTSP